MTTPLPKLLATVAAIGMCSAFALGLAAPDATGGTGKTPTPSSLANPLLHGIAKPARSATISAPLEDIIQSIGVAEGDRVEAGDTLAVLDDRVPRATLAAAETRAAAVGDIAGTEAGVEIARHQLSRVQQIFDQGAAAGPELEDAQLNFRRAEAALQAARERAASAGRDAELQADRLARCTIAAPFDGTIARVVAQPGEMAGPGEPLLTIVDLETLRVEFHLPAAMYRGVRIGDTATLHASTPVDRTLRGTMIVVEPIIDPATRTFRCVYEVKNTGGRLPSGFTATIDPADIERISSAAFAAADTD